MSTNDQARKRAIRDRMHHSRERYTHAARAVDAGTPLPAGPWDPVGAPIVPRDPEVMRALVEAYRNPVVWPPRRRPHEPDGRCPDGQCQGVVNALREANPLRRGFDTPDSAFTRCYHCGGAVCMGCGAAHVEGGTPFCPGCGSDIAHERDDDAAEEARTAARRSSRRTGRRAARS